MKIPTAFSEEIERSILKFIWYYKRPQTHSWKRTKLKDIPLLQCKTYYKTTAIKTTCHWFKERHTDQLNKTEFRNKPIKLWTTNVWQACHVYSTERKQSLQQTVMIQLIFHMQKNEIAPSSSHHVYKLTQNGPTLRIKIHKTLRRKHRVKSPLAQIWQCTLRYNTKKHKTQQIKWDSLKLKTFCINWQSKKRWKDNL